MLFETSSSGVKLVTVAVSTLLHVGIAAAALTGSGLASSHPSAPAPADGTIEVEAAPANFLPPSESVEPVPVAPARALPTHAHSQDPSIARAAHVDHED